MTSILVQRSIHQCDLQRIEFRSWHGFCRAPLSWDVLPCLVCQPPQAQAPFWSSAKQYHTNFVQAAFSGDTATLTTHGVQPNNLDFNPGRDHANREYSDSSHRSLRKPSPGVTSSTPQTGDLKGGFSGEIIISQFSAGTGIREIALATTFSGGTLKADGTSGSLAASAPLNTVTLQPTNALVEAALGGTTGVGAFALSFAGVTPPQSGPFTDFTAQNSGVFSTAAFISRHSRARLDRDVALGRAALGRAGHARLQAASAQVQVI